MVLTLPLFQAGDIPQGRLDPAPQLFLGNALSRRPDARLGLSGQGDPGQVGVRGRLHDGLFLRLTAAPQAAALEVNVGDDPATQCEVQAAAACRP